MAFLLDGRYRNPGIPMGYRDGITLATSTLYATHNYYNIRNTIHCPSIPRKPPIALVTIRSFISLYSWGEATNNGRLQHRPTNRMCQAPRNTYLISNIPKTTYCLSDISICLAQIAKQMKKYSSSSADIHKETRH